MRRLSVSTLQFVLPPDPVVMLREAIKPNLLQTLENTPVLVHNCGTQTGGRRCSCARGVPEESGGEAFFPYQMKQIEEAYDKILMQIRAQYSLGPSNYVGAMVTDTTFAGSYNRVAGVDFKWRLTETQRFDTFRVGYNIGQQRRAAANLTADALRPGVDEGLEARHRTLAVDRVFGRRREREFRDTGDDCKIDVWSYFENERIVRQGLERGAPSGRKRVVELDESGIEPTSGVLAKEGLAEIETNGAFDPNVHEALLSQLSDEPAGSVIAGV